MTTTPPEAPDDTGPRRSAAELRDLARLRRSTTDRHVAGVAGGLGRHLDVDPVILRVCFVVFSFFGGAGLLLYVAGWLFVPEDGRDDAAISLDERSRSLVLVVVAGLAGLAVLSDVVLDGDWWFPWPLVLITLLVAWLLTRRSGTPGPVGTTPPPPGVPVVRPPRRRGPLLFVFTLALVALAMGVLGTADLAGAPVAAAAYPAVALALIGVMLTVGAFFGRAGGLILVGLLVLPVLAVAAGVDHYDGEDLLRVPTTAGALDDSYAIDAGEMVIDLRSVTDLEELDGRTLTLAVDLGRIEVIVPEGLEVRAETEVSGPGHIDLFGSETGGIDNRLDGTSPRRAAGAPLLRIDAEVGVGQIEMRTR